MKRVIRALTDADLIGVAQVHSQAFPRQGLSLEWVRCNAQAFPRMRYYVADAEDEICGFILWTEKSGFRNDVVLELEQIAVAPSHQKRGVGEALIRQSLPQVVAQLAERGGTLRAVMVTTRADNGAQRLYARVLGAKVEATIPSLYSADEVVMIATTSQSEEYLIGDEQYPDGLVKKYPDGRKQLVSVSAKGEISVIRDI